MHFYNSHVVAMNVLSTGKQQGISKMQSTLLNINTVKKLLPLIAFVIPFLILYSLYPQSFQGSPTWEGSWQGRFFYLFFLWLLSLEFILGWEELQKSKVNRLRSVRTVAFIIAFLLPTIYVIAANYGGLNAVIAESAARYNVPLAYLTPLSTEYFVFAVLFNLIILLAYGINGLKEFSISAFFLGIIGIIYIIDILYPYGRFTPFQLLVPTTATFAANFLNLMGYETSLSLIENHPIYGTLPYLVVEDSLGRSAGFGIAWPCSGIESLIIYTVTILLFLRKTAIPLTQKAVYFVIGAAVTYFINILRIVSIFLIALDYGANSSQVQLFHNYYGPLYSIIWVISYPLIIIGSRALWRKIKNRKTGTRDVSKSPEIIP